jgi:hypothetical protein
MAVLLTLRCVMLGLDDTLWTGPRWRLLVAAICLSLDSNKLCPLPGLELVLPAAASFSDRISICLVVFCGPAVRFRIRVFRV